MSSLRRTRSLTELTPAETRVLERVQLGESNSEIARALFVSIRTVESHVSSIQRKSGTTSRLKLVAGRFQPGPD
jgi:DNA-binding NarL/FixJ family response regulator